MVCMNYYILNGEVLQKKIIKFLAVNSNFY